MIIKVNKSNVFYNYLLWLDPLLELTKIERSILASLLTLHFHNKGKIEEPELSRLILSDETFGLIRKKLRLGKKLFDSGILKLKLKGYLLETGIAPKFTNYDSNNKFSILVEFQLTNE